MIQSILLALDGSEEPLKVVDSAILFAMKFEARLYILYVVPNGKIPDKIVEYVKAERLDGSLGKISAKVIGEAVLEPILKRVRQGGVREAKWMVLYGDPADEILGFAKNRKIDMIIMGKRGGGRLKELLLGGVARKVCQLSECICMTV